MALFRLRVNVRTNGRPRSLLLFEEQEAGDVYIRIKSGTQVGIPPDAIPIKQDRYSVHASPKSPKYTTIKKTFELANGYKDTNVALTDAVKCGTGFACVFVHRASDLQAPLYDLRAEPFPMVIEVGDFDPAQHALYVGLFVGSHDAVFPDESDKCRIRKFRSKLFQFVLCYVWGNMPALPEAWTMNLLTFPPEDEDDEFAYEKMAGKSPEDTLELFDVLRAELTVNLLQAYMKFSDDPEMIKFLTDSIDAIPRVPQIRM